MASILTVPVPKKFDLARTVCSYGYFVLSPNRWVAKGRGGGELHRPLRDRYGRVIRAEIRQVGRFVKVRCHRAVGRSHHALLKDQVIRMLRIDEDQRAWWALHPQAAAAGFGRIFRSPSLFEDIVKTITGCNVAWANTQSMNRHLCGQVGLDGDFPLPSELARWTPQRLASKCKVGYRADWIIRLARWVHTGKLSMAWLEDSGRGTEELFEALRQIHGVGEYAANNILQGLGRYDRVPVDSETVRLFRRKHKFNGKVSQVKALARKRYDPYKPYQFKAYWFSLWGRPEDRNVRFGSD